MKKNVSSWQPQEGQEYFPEEYRPRLVELYKVNKRLKKGDTFKVGKIVIQAIPEVSSFKNNTYRWSDFRNTFETWSTE